MEEYGFLVVDHGLDMKEYLVLVERTVESCYNDTDLLPEDRILVLGSELAVFAYDQGTYAASADSAEWAGCSPLERIRRSIEYGHDRWVITSDYLRDTHSINIHPLFYLEFMDRLSSKFLEDNSEDTFLQLVKTVVLEFMTELTKRGEEAVQQLARIADAKSDQVDADVEEFLKTGNIDAIQHDPMDNPGLLSVYFDLMDQLGEFHQDIEQYDSVEKKVLHGRLMEVYYDLTH